MKVKDTVMCICLGLLSITSVCAESLKIHFIHVAGDAMLVQTPNDKSILIDAGRKHTTPELIDYLEHLGIEKIDIAFCTHSHSDHIQGFMYSNGVCAAFHVSKFYGVDDGHTKLFFDESVIPTSQNRDISFHTVSRGDKIDLDPDIDIEILFPPVPTPVGMEMNDRSASCLITDLRNGVTFLLMADAMLDQHRELSTLYPDGLRCDLIKFGHHTQYTLEDETSIPGFLQMVKPAYGIITKQNMPKPGPAYHVMTTNSFRQLFEYTWTTDSGLKNYMLAKHGDIVAESTIENGIVISYAEEEAVPPTIKASKPSGRSNPFTLTLSLSKPTWEWYPEEIRGFYSTDDGLSWNEFGYPQTSFKIEKNTSVITFARDLFGNSSETNVYTYSIR